MKVILPGVSTKRMAGPKRKTFGMRMVMMRKARLEWSLVGGYGDVIGRDLMMCEMHMDVLGRGIDLPILLFVNASSMYVMGKGRLSRLTKKEEGVE